MVGQDAYSFQYITTNLHTVSNSQKSEIGCYFCLGGGVASFFVFGAVAGLCVEMDVTDIACKAKLAKLFDSFEVYRNFVEWPRLRPMTMIFW